MATFTTSDGIDIRYEVRGKGPPVYVCQGGPSNICDTLIAELTPLENRHRLVFHDYRGSGQSAAAPADTYRFERLADDLDELRRHLGDGSIAVLAHSMGGFIALHYALRHAATCQALVLVGTTPCGASRPMAVPVLRALGLPRTLKALAIGMRFLLLWSWRPASRERTMAMYAPMSVLQEPRPELRAKVAAARAMSGLPVENDNAEPLMNALGGVDLRAELAAVACPVMVLYGSRDAAMVAGGTMLQRGIPHAEVTVLPQIGHEPFIEAPDETFPVIRDFLARHAGEQPELRGGTGGA